MSRGLAVLGAERAGVVELVGGLEREGLDALEGALGDAGQGAGRRHLEDAGDAEVDHRLQAEVPADRAGDLADDAGEHLAAVVDDLAVAVGDHAGARVVDRHRAGQRGQVADRGLPCARCGRRRRRGSGISRALAGGSAAKAASCSRVPAATIWPGPLSLAAVRPCCVERGQHLVAVAAEDGGHAGRGDRGGLGHRVAALADQHHRLLGGDHAGAGGGGDLADAVAGDGADLLEGVGGVREELERGDQAGRDQQRLGDLRCRGSCRRRPRCRSGPGRARRRSRASAKRGAKVGSSSQGARKPGVWAPWPGATMTSTTSLCRARASTSPPARTKLSPRFFVGFLQRRRAGVPGAYAPDWRPSTRRDLEGEGVPGVGRGVSPVRSATWRRR